MRVKIHVRALDDGLANRQASDEQMARMDLLAVILMISFVLCLIVLAAGIQWAAEIATDQASGLMSQIARSLAQGPGNPR